MNLVGMLLVVVAGAMEGLFSLGVTRTPNWKWENIWSMGSLIALLLIPWPVALLTVPHLMEAYSQVSPGLLALVFLFGVGWGVGGIFWGKGIAAVGVALGVSLLMGLITVTGSLGPMLVREPEKLTTRGGEVLIGAMALMTLGVVIISLAGRQKERELSGHGAAGNGRTASDIAAESGAVAVAVAAPPATSFATGLLFCVISGVLSASVNFGLIYGAPIAKSAGDLGASKDASANAIWALVFTGNYLVNFLYALVVMFQNRTTGKLREGGPSHWFWALFLGVSWPLGIVVYGVAAGKLGAYGAYVGFPMMLLCAILFGNLAGAITGEWRGTSARPRATMLLGVATLVLAFVVFGWANKLFAA